MTEMRKTIKIRRKTDSDPMNHITVHQTGEVVYLTFPLLEQIGGITHGFSTRLGGVSRGYVGSMNLSFGREESRENVAENHRRLAAAIGYDAGRLVCSRQTHTTNVIAVKEGDWGVKKTRDGGDDTLSVPMTYLKDPEYNDIDGLVTNVPGIALMTFYADCVPLLLVDPVHRAVGTSHSGWRGTVANMGKATLEVMQREYGTDPRDVRAAIGPSICQDCYEVSKDVIDQFKNAYSQEVWPELFYEKPDGKFQLNLWEACRRNFIGAGVPKDQISMPDLCTCCNPDLLFSHRASQGKRGNLAAVIMLDP